MAWKNRPVTSPTDFDEKLKKVLDAVMKMTDDELEANAGAMILYQVSSGFVAVSTSNDSMSKEELLEALHDITEAIEEYGVPDGPKVLRSVRNFWQ